MILPIAIKLACMRNPMRLGRNFRFFNLLVGVHGGGGTRCCLPGVRLSEPRLMVASSRGDANLTSRSRVLTWSDLVRSNDPSL